MGLAFELSLIYLNPIIKIYGSNTLISDIPTSYSSFIYISCNDKKR